MTLLHSVNFEHFSEPWPLFTLPNLLYDPHDDIFEQITPHHSVELVRGFLSRLQLALNVINWVAHFGFEVAVLRDEDAC